MALLRTAATLYPERTALVDERERLTYRTLLQHSQQVAAALRQEQGIRSGQRTAIVCRNHASAVKALFALSLLGTHTVLISPDISRAGLHQLEDEWQFDLYVYDNSSAHLFVEQPVRSKAIPSYQETGNSIHSMSTRPVHSNVKFGRQNHGSLVVLTGGTTGRPKAAHRRPSITRFLSPFISLLTTANLHCYRSLYVATPIVHGFGLASLIMGLALGTEIYLSERFDPQQSCALIEQNKIDVVVLVPLILQRMLQHDTKALSSLQCILTGGAPLAAELANKTLAELGQKLFNLYGSSEAGVCIISTPTMIRQKPESIGKPMNGVKARIVDNTGNNVEEHVVGHLRIQSKWSTHRNYWIETGDLAYRDADGDIFLAGRIDDMIVSGGHNVYPLELERALRQHPELEAVAVVGITDTEFGQRLKSVVVRKEHSTINESEIRDWLRPRIARYQMPGVVEFRDELPYTALGKVDTALLRDTVKRT